MLEGKGENEVFREISTFWHPQSPFQTFIQESFRILRVYFRCFNPSLFYCNEAVESGTIKWSKSPKNSKKGLPAAPGLA